MGSYRLFILMIGVLCAAAMTAFGQVGDYEGRPVASVEVILKGSPADVSAQAEFRSLLRILPNTEYSAVAARQSLQDLFASGRVATAQIEITEAEAGAGRNRPIRVRFVIERQIVISGVTLRLTPATGTPVAGDEIRARLTLLEPGRRYSQRAIERNADEIQAYLRDRGYYSAAVEASEEPDPSDATGTRRRVIYTVTPGEPAKVANFAIDIKGFDATKVQATLRLQRGALFTTEALGEDVNQIRQAILAQGHLAPLLNDPVPRRNPETKQIEITLDGRIGPKVEVAFKNYPLSEKKQKELLPVKREGSVDFSAIEEGARRVRNELQQQGYFFADVNPTCTVTPPTPTTIGNGTVETCQNLNAAELGTETLNITYEVILRRRLKLTEIRITGTNKLSIIDVAEELKTTKASAVGFLPFLGGYGRGFTNNALLQEDIRTITAHMQDLGYRGAKVDVVEGIGVNSDNLIITFNVTEGLLTRLAGIEVRGEKAFPDDLLRKEIKSIVESLLFVSDGPQTVQRFGEVLDGVDKETIHTALRELQTEFEAQNRGVRTSHR